MSRLSLYTLILAGVLALLHGGLVACPAQARRLLVRFPRDVWAGRILTVIALVWAGFCLKAMPMGGLDTLKVHLIWAVPALIVATCIWMDELLAPRALGGILLLVPAPLLAAVRESLQVTPWAAAISVICYLMIIKGMALVVAPYLFRKSIERALPDDGRLRLAGVVWLVIDGGMAALALTVLR